MFNILQEWLTCKLGTHYCWNLNFNNVGERFKDGFLFAVLFQKYQVMPKKYVHIFKKTNQYDACLNNMKSINLWLKFMEIIIEDRTIHEIAHGQSLAVTTLLYKLYFKFEMTKECQIINNINIEDTQKLNDNIMINFCKNDGSFLSHQKELKDKIKPNENYEKFNYISKLYFSSDGISYTAIDVLKSMNCINTCKGNALKLLQHNMNSFYKLFMMSLNNSKFLPNKFIKKSDEVLSRSMLLNIFNKKKENNITTDNKNFTATKLDYKNDIQNIDLVSQKDLKNESSIVSNLKIEESIISQGLDEFKNTHFEKQDIFNEYLQHTGPWSSEYLSVDSFKYKQNILSMIIKEVLNFEYGISEIKFIKIKNTNVAGVIDVIQNTKVVKLIKDNLQNKGILGFTAEDALNMCLKVYNEEMKISLNKSKLYQVIEPSENQAENSNITSENSENNYSDYNINEVKKRTNNDSTNSMSVIITNRSNISEESIYTTNKKPINKLIQTPETIPEPDYNNPILSTMANLGKIIDEKQKKNHDLQIADEINCIGEYIKLNQDINGWILLQFPVQPLQMALLEFMLTGKMPYFGKEICEKSKKKSSIVPDYQDSENMYTATNTYLTNCIKIIQHVDEIYSEKLYDFIQFYKQQNSIQIQISNINNIIKEPKKAADNLVGLILNEEKVKSPSIFFKPVNIDSRVDNIDNNEDDSIKSENDYKQISTLPSTTSGDKTETTYEIANQFQILSIDLGRNEGNLTNYTFTALYLCDIWKTMEHNYTHKIKKLLNNKENFFKEVRTSNDLSIKTMFQVIQLQNSCILNLLNKYENKTQNLLKDNYKNLKYYIFELQTNLWDEVDNELEQVTAFIENTIYEQWILKNNTLISTYNKLLETEMKRAITTLKFLNRYYVDINETKTNEFEFNTVIINNNDDIDTFQMHCLDIINKFKIYIYNNYEAVEKINQETWTVSVQTETNRLINQVYRIKASSLKDSAYLKDLTSIDHYLEKLHAIYKFKINDINKLCELLECAGKNTEVHIEYISGQFFVNKLSVFEIICKQVFHSKNKFKIEQLRSIVNKLLDYAPTFKIEIVNFIDILNKLCKINHIGLYPKQWPKDDKFYNEFYKELFGSNITTIDWRDFVVQCMDLPYPTIEQLLFYRKLLQDYDIGNETITIQSYKATQLWFENESNQYNNAKWLLYDMYQVQDGLNYSTMLLAFCKDEKPWIGLGKSFSLIFGWNPFDLKTQQTKQLIHKYEESENDIDYMNTVNNEIIYSPEVSPVLSYEEFIFDQDIMTWFLLKNFKLYIDSKNQIGNINIPKIVKSIFLNYQTQQIIPTVIDIFRNIRMDDLYSTVHKFQAKKLPEIAKKIVLKFYNLSSLL